MSIKYHSPLRYPGGKSKAVALFRDIVRINGLQGCVYVEPFAGGASVALGLLFEGDADRIIINDADPSIYSFWNACLYQIDDFCTLLNSTEINIETWLIQKEIYQKQRSLAMQGLPYDTLSLGFATFFLNRTNRSGILKGGMIGGHSQKGKYGIAARFNRAELESRLRNVSAHVDRIEIHCEEARFFLENHANDWPLNTLIYCDPPYVEKGKGLYMNYLNEQDHKVLAEVIKRIQDKHWVVTYDKHDLIAELYMDYPKKTLMLNYSVAHNHSSKSEEYIFFSSNLRIPNNVRLSNV